MSRVSAVILYLILSLVVLPLSAQRRVVAESQKVDESDTLYRMPLKELYYFSWDKLKKRKREWREFYRLVYNFKRVYPYSLMAKEKILEADRVIATSNFTANQREKFLKKFEIELFREFEKPLRKLTISQGQLLLLLIDREVGESSYSLIRGYRGRAAAGFWQGIAKLFGSDLKRPYDKFGEDRVIEELVQMYQRGNFEALYFSIFN
ncbi:MAG: DUF4294 domain-containing protein [Bacteroidales bacterium]